MNVPVKHSSRQMTRVLALDCHGRDEPAVAVRILIPQRFPQRDTIDLINSMGTVVQTVSYLRLV
jgi:hypothetical protein